MLAATHSNRIFEPGCLTEDYENGFRVASLGMRPEVYSEFISGMGGPLRRANIFRGICAARCGSGRDGLRGLGCNRGSIIRCGETLRYAYWFWRDRKSLVGNLIGPLTEFAFFMGW